MEPKENGKRLVRHVIANARNAANVDTMDVMMDLKNAFTMNEQAVIMEAMSENPMIRAVARAENDRHQKEKRASARGEACRHQGNVDLKYGISSKQNNEALENPEDSESD